jgi:hypothetical protein
MLGLNLKYAHHGCKPFEVMFHRQANEFKYYTTSPTRPNKKVNQTTVKEMLKEVDNIIIPAIHDQIQIMTIIKRSIVSRKNHFQLVLKL